LTAVLAAGRYQRCVNSLDRGQFGVHLYSLSRSARIGERASQERQTRTFLPPLGRDTPVRISTAARPVLRYVGSQFCLRRPVSLNTGWLWVDRASI
jgi:hypothetical protein